MFQNLGGQGLFGQQQQLPQVQNTGGLFSGQPQSQGLFGNPQQTPSLGGSLGLGQQPNTGTGLFGNPGGQQQLAGGGLFQPQQQQQMGMPTTGGVGLFGQSQTPAVGGLFAQQGQGGFGQPAASTSSGLFGQQTNITPQTGGGIFGAAQTQTPFAQPSIGGFGQQQQQQQQTGQFGGFNPSGGLFGQQPTQQPQQTPFVGGGGLFSGGQQPPQQPNTGGFFSNTQQQSWGNPQQNTSLGFGNQANQPQGVGQTGLCDSINDINMDQSCTPLTDSFSAIAWNYSNLRFLAGATWEGCVRVYEIVQNPSRNELAERRVFKIDNSSPNNANIPNSLLTLDWKTDGSMIFVGCGIDNTVRAVQVATGQAGIIGRHDGPVIAVFWADAAQVLVSISTDSTLKVWSLNQPGNPSFAMNFQYKPLVADMNYPLIMIGFASEKLTILNLTQIQNMKNPHYFDSQLGINSRLTALSLFPNRDGFGTGSVDGRGHMSNIMVKTQGFNQNVSHYECKQIMTFKAHKIEDSTGGQKVNYFFPVNAVQFNIRNPKFMVTAGSEGLMVFWDYEVKNKIKTLSFNNVPIVCIKMSPDGKYLAYALGNDFSKGQDSYQLNYPNKICVKFIADNELRCNPK